MDLLLNGTLTQAQYDAIKEASNNKVAIGRITSATDSVSLPIELSSFTGPSIGIDILSSCQYKGNVELVQYDILINADKSFESKEAVKTVRDYSFGNGLVLNDTSYLVTPTYGTAANTICQGNDSRLSNSRPASDVSAWAKASTKPTYTAAEVGALAASGTAAAATKLATARTINGVSFNGTANVSVNTVQPMKLQVNGGTTENTNMYTFNGSAAKTLNIAAGSNVTLTATAGKLTIASTNTTYAVATQSANGLMSAADKKRLDFEYGQNTVSTLASLPVTKRTINANLSAASTLSLAAALEEGQELQIRCMPSAAFTLTMPTASGFTSMSGPSLVTVANVPFEINVWCYKAGNYSIAILERA